MKTLDARNSFRREAFTISGLLRLCLEHSNMHGALPTEIHMDVDDFVDFNSFFVSPNADVMSKQFVCEFYGIPIRVFDIELEISLK